MKVGISFLVPCYNLGHLLGECLDSILAQSYRDFEVLVLDDCSPDQTAAVAQKYKDPRVKHIRHAQNVGHLRNYNKGIELARGRYVWLISADDRLRSATAAQRYVETLDANTDIGYAFCPALALQGGVENELIGYSYHGSANKVIPGREFLASILVANKVIAASGMVRKECYDKYGSFPLDLPYAGDWYLWCLFALHFDVAYFAEPMVCYRQHAGSMTNQLYSERARLCVADEFAVRWRIRKKAEQAGALRIYKQYEPVIAAEYVQYMLKRHPRVSEPMSQVEFELSLERNVASEAERRRMRGRVFARLGDEQNWQNGRKHSVTSYKRALQAYPCMPQVWIKLLLAWTGASAIRRWLGIFRNFVFCAS